MYIEYVLLSCAVSATLTLHGPSWASIRSGFLRAGGCIAAAVVDAVMRTSCCAAATCMYSSGAAAAAAGDGGRWGESSRGIAVHQKVRGRLEG